MLGHRRSSARWASRWALCLALAAPALAQAAPSFLARADRTRVPVDDSFIVEITLSLESGSATGYRSPSFKGLRVLSEQPSQSHQFRFGAGGSFNQTVYLWRYELQPTATGEITIGPARVTVDGKTLETAPLHVTVTDAVGGARARPPMQRRSPFAGLLDPLAPEPEPAAATGGENFLLAVPTKTRVFVGEQLNVDWSLFLSERQDKYQPMKEPRTDGFWVEELPLPRNLSQGLHLEQREHNGRVYLAATLLRRALFPLRPGKLEITPLEAEIARMSFLGTQVRSEKLATETLVIEVEPLPAAGRPADFDGLTVGRFDLSASADRTTVEVGDAVTVTVILSGEGNINKLPVPALPPLEGWKRYEPKITVNLTPGERITGEKRAEYLLLPERAGISRLPGFELCYFDPTERAYRRARSEPIVLTVRDGAAGDPGPALGQTAAPGSPQPAQAENLLPVELRPIRSGEHLTRDLGATLYRSTAFFYLLLFPPALFGLSALGLRVRERLGRETERGQKRALRRLVKQRLRAANQHREAGAAGAFFLEIDRVLRDLLSARLRTPVSGLSRDELRVALVTAGASTDLAQRLCAVLDACDQARFAPGAPDPEVLRATQDETEELIVLFERAATERASPTPKAQGTSP